jgi:uncharacterized protein
MLKIASNLSLPDDAVTQTVSILAKRRAGKSYTARRFAEQLFNAGQQIVIADPKGDWWGIRSSADGKSPGLPIVILGGERGDVPLEAHSGEIVAKLVVIERVSVLIDLSLLRKHEVATFMTAFLENVYRIKAREIYRTPMMLIIDEADAIAPQHTSKGEERMLGAAEDIVRRGGQRGIGCTLITQRSASINKHVLTQTQILVALRTIAPQDLKAMNAWIDVHGTEEQRSTLMSSLPALPTGDAWVWSPGWPSVDGIFKRVTVLPIETFDSGATPKPGEKRKEPKNIADVDLESLKRQMADTIERAKADDPKELRKQIAELKKQLASKSADPAAIETAVRKAIGERDHYWMKEISKVRGIVDSLKKKVSQGQTQAEQLVATLRLNGEAEYKSRIENGIKSAPELHGSVESVKPVLQNRPPRTEAQPHTSDLPKGERIVLTAIAQHGEASREQLTVLTGYKRSSRDAYLQRLRERGCIEIDGDRISATDAGVKALGPNYAPLPTGDDLRDYWLSKLPEGERRILSEVIEVYPHAIERDTLSEVTSYKRSSRDAYLQRLQARKLVSCDRGIVRASDTLFG